MDVSTIVVEPADVHIHLASAQPVAKTHACRLVTVKTPAKELQTWA